MLTSRVHIDVSNVHILHLIVTICHTMSHYVKYCQIKKERNCRAVHLQSRL